MPCLTLLLGTAKSSANKQVDVGKRLGEVGEEMCAAR